MIPQGWGDPSEFFAPLLSISCFLGNYLPESTSQYYYLTGALNPREEAITPVIPVTLLVGATGVGQEADWPVHGKDKC